jgi:hypothetical protein
MTYDEVINLIFDYCVDLLIIGARSIGMTYEEINVWFFIVFEPIVFAIVVLYAWYLKHQNAHLRKQLEPITHPTDRSSHRCTGYLLSPRTS